MIQSPDTELLPARSRFLRLVCAHVDERAASQLFDLFNVIAVLRYEDIENSGTLALCAPDTPLPPMVVRFGAAFQLQHVRGVRKYLHITDENLCLVSDFRSAYGFTTRKQLNRDILTVEFRREGVWELRKGGDLLLRVDAPAAGIPNRTVDRGRLARELRDTFPVLSVEQIDFLGDLADAAARQAQGTNVLISAKAAQEARRLVSQCTLVEPVPFTAMLMERCTSVDGTVIIDTEGICYAIGAILDGHVSERGDRTRGGRYNSALMYVDTVGIRSLIVVVSRDGTVDIVSSGGKHGLE